jgi:hypothetical protein
LNTILEAFIPDCGCNMKSWSRRIINHYGIT